MKNDNCNLCDKPLSALRSAKKVKLYLTYRDTSRKQRHFYVGYDPDPDIETPIGKDEKYLKIIYQIYETVALIKREKQIRTLQEFGQQLSSKWVRGMIARDSTLSREDIPDDVVELQRMLFIARRKLKEAKNEYGRPKRNIS